MKTTKRNRIRIDTTIDSISNQWLLEQKMPKGRVIDNMVLNEMLKERNLKFKLEKDL